MLRFMETNTSATSTDLPDEDLGGASLGGRLKSRISVVQTRLTHVPELARAQWTGLPRQVNDLTDRLAARVASRVRDTLDLPSRSEFDELLARIAQLDAALAALSKGNKKAPASKKSAAKKAKSSGANKTDGPARTGRKAKIKQSAAKRKKA